MKKKRKVKDYAEIPYTRLRITYDFCSWVDHKTIKELKEILEDVPYSTAVEVIDLVNNKIHDLWDVFNSLYSSPIAKREEEFKEALREAGYRSGWRQGWRDE